MIYLNLLSYLLFIAMIGYYFIVNMQWYNYKIERVIFHHTKVWWHFVYFLIPFILFEFVSAVTNKHYGFIVVLLYLPLFILWYKGIDKKLVFTRRVKRFFGLLFLFAIFITFSFEFFTIFIPILLASLISRFIETMLFDGFKKSAKEKIENMDKLIVIGITASYGKTSIKNYVEHILQSKYNTYATPRSVNTLGGVVKDINNDLPSDTEVYVVEMGARGKGDIADIATLVNPHYVIVGKIGPAHIEYFKTMENIRNTKMEILQTNRLQKAWIHESAVINPIENIYQFGKDITDIKASLDGVSFTLEGVEYHANVLGEFNAMNLAAAVKISKILGIEDETLRQRLNTLKAVPHRLQRIDAGGKIILDDSFNGNIDGMMASFKLADTHNGRKVIVTPGLVEVDEALNIQVAQKANEIFDVVIVTGDLNYAVFKEYIDADKLHKLSSKADMEEMLVTQTIAGDLILFANDAPSFI